MSKITRLNVPFKIYPASDAPFERIPDLLICDDIVKDPPPTAEQVKKMHAWYKDYLIRVE